MAETSDLMELRDAAIRAHYPEAMALLEGFEHRPRSAEAAARPERSSGLGTRRRFRSTTPGLAAHAGSGGDQVRLLERLAAVDDDALPSAIEAGATRALRRAISLAKTLSELFSEATPLADLKHKNRESPLSGPQELHFSNLLEAEALVSLQVFAVSLKHLLSGYEAEIVDDLEAHEVILDSGSAALRGALWELDRHLAAHGSSEGRVIAVMSHYAEALQARIAPRAAGHGETAAFARAAYRSDPDDLTIRGFTSTGRGTTPALAMQFKAPHEVVGNHIAKYQAMKLAKMLMAYDFERRLNPFAELGGFIFTFMGDGKPGTGKTTLIQMMAGLIHGYCEVAGYPFRYMNLSTDSIDSYQGKSAQNAKQFVTTILDPEVIGFGTIDDIDQLAGKRGDRQSSAGQLEITAVLMESFAGANTVVRGNCTFGMFSNYPEAVDDALRQRAGARFLVDGPQSREDYIDILTLLLGKNHDIPLGQHELYAAQEIRRAVRESYDRHSRPQEDALAEVFEQVQDELGPLDTLAKMGRYLKAIQMRDERFTGRAIKNITDAVKVRAMDFELPDAWMEEPDLFLRQDYDTKRAMIDELRQPITPEMVLQEINRYADSEFRYSESSDEAAIESAIRDMARMEEARRRYKGQGA